MEQSHRFQEIWTVILQNGAQGVTVSNEELHRLERLFLKGKWILALLPLLMIVWKGLEMLVPALIGSGIIMGHNLLSYAFIRMVPVWKKRYSTSLRLWELVGSSFILTFIHMTIGGNEYNAGYLIVIIHALLIGGLHDGLLLLLSTFPMVLISNLFVVNLNHSGTYPGAFVDAVTHEVLFAFLLFMTLWVVGQSNRYRIDSEIDGLTALYNHRYFYQSLTQFLSQKNKMLTVALADIDNFKKINDDYGHLTGDKVLSQVAACLRDKMPDLQVIARYGGEEFGILLQDVPIEKSKALLQNMRISVSDLSIDTGKEILQGITMSFGVVNGFTDDHSPTEWVQKADQALYDAKKAGKNRIEYLIN